MKLLNCYNANNGFVGLPLRSIEPQIKMTVEQGGSGSCDNRSGVLLQTNTSIPSHYDGNYDAESARMEAWMDENSEFVHDYFLRKAPRHVIDNWLLSHATPATNNSSVVVTTGENSSPTHSNSQPCSSRGGSGATTPVR